MANKYKSEFGPGSYRQVIPHDFSKSSKLRTANTKDLQDQEKRNILLAQRNRDDLNSLSNQQQVEASARGTVLEYDKQVRTMQFNSDMNAAVQAQKAAIERSKQLAREGKAADERLVKIVNQTLDLGVDIYNKLDAAAFKQNQSDFIASQIKIGSSAEENAMLWGMKREEWDNTNDTESYIYELKQQGVTWNDVKGIVGAREDVFKAGQVQTLKSQLPNMHAQLVAEDPMMPNGMRYVEGLTIDPAASDAFYRNYVAKSVGILNEHNIDLAHVLPTIHQANAARDSQVVKLRSDFAQDENERHEDTAMMSVIHAIGETGSYDDINRKFNRDHRLIPKHLKTLERLVQDGRLDPYKAQNILNNLVGGPNGLSILDPNNKYSGDAFDVLKAIREQQLWNRQGDNQKRLDVRDKIHEVLDELEKGAIPLDPGNIEAIRAQILDADLSPDQTSTALSRFARIAKPYLVESSGAQRAMSIIASGGNTGFELSYDQLQAMVRDPKEFKAVLTHLNFLKNNNRLYNDHHKKDIIQAIKERSGAFGQGRDDENRDSGAIHNALTTYENTVRANLGRMTDTEAMNNAYAEFIKEFGPPDKKFEGKYRVNDLTENPGGGSGYPEFGADSIRVTAASNPTYDNITASITEGLGNKTGTIGERRTWVADNTSFTDNLGLTNEALTGLISGKFNYGNWRTLYQLNRATTNMLGTPTELAQHILDKRGVEVQPAQQGGNTQGGLLESLRIAIGSDNAALFAGGKQPPIRGKVDMVNPTPEVDLTANKGGYAADTGLDIHGPEGTPIVSMLPGTLVYAEKGHSAQMGQSSSSKGYTDQHSVLIKLDKPFTHNGKQINYAWYTHLQDLNPAIANKTGIKVNAGQHLGGMGIANGVSHLHLGLVGDRAQTVYLNYKEVREVLGGNQ